MLLRCFSDETDRQRAELQQQHDAELKTAVDKLTSLHDSELASLKQNWQQKVNDLLHEVEMFKCCWYTSACFWYSVTENSELVVQVAQLTLRGCATDLTAQYCKPQSLQ